MRTYRLFKPKTNSSATFDDLILGYLDNFRTKTSTVTVNGFPLYINANERRFIEIVYGSKKVQYRIMTNRDYGLTSFEDGEDSSPNKVKTIHMYFDDNEGVRKDNAHKICAGIDMHFQKVKLVSKHNLHKREYDIEVPFELINEIDFFQVEVQNPVLPLSAKAFTKFVNKMIEVF